jgi:hypothetical protein
MTKLIKKLYARYFQKSRSFLLPILGIKKDTAYPCINSYLCWTGIYSLSDYKLILTYDKADDDKWNKYLLNILMSNPMFDEYHEVDHQIHSYETGATATTDEHLNELRAKRVHLKDALYEYLNQ